MRRTALLTTEGTYPFHRGDVSTWCHSLTRALSDTDFTLLAITTHPYLAVQYDLGANVTNVITVPVSGMDDPAEFGNHASLPDYVRRRLVTTATAVEQDYVPHFERFLRQILGLASPADSELAQTLLDLHLHLRQCDYDVTQRHQATWERFARVLREAWRKAQPDAAAPSTADVVLGWRLLYRLLLPLSVNVPRVDVVHAAAPGFCGLPCVIAKLRWGTPYLLTEHAPYVREHYLRVTNEAASPLARWLFGRVVSAVVDVNYAFADQVSPVCRRTAEWERWRGVAASRIRTIYNGVSPSPYAPRHDAHYRPTIVNIAEFNGLKGQLELIEAAALLRRTLPDVQLRLYGPVEDEAYYQRCRGVAQAMNLGDAVVFGGDVIDSGDALRQADVFALASQSDGLPYALLEAMVAEIPIVATDAGGAREAVGEGGLIVPPGDPVALVEALATLLQMRDTARRCGEHARERALKKFTEERWVNAYRASYDRLTGRGVDAETGAKPAPADVTIHRLRPAAIAS